MQDLIALVADKNMEYTLRAGLKRHDSLGIRLISFEILQHVQRDGGVRSTGPELIRLKRRSFSHALVVFDYEGSGAQAPPEVIEARLDDELRPVWGFNAKAIARCTDPALKRLRDQLRLWFPVP